MQYQLSIPYHCILWCPCNTWHTLKLHGHRIVTCLVITVTENPYFNKLLRFQDISHERCKKKSPYILDIYLIVAFKYESPITGHQIYDESSLITQNFRDYVKLNKKNEVHFSVWPDISTGEYIFLPFISSYYSSFDAYLVACYADTRIWYPGNTESQ